MSAALTANKILEIFKICCRYVIFLEETVSKYLELLASPRQLEGLGTWPRSSSEAADPTSGTPPLEPRDLSTPLPNASTQRPTKSSEKIRSPALTLCLRDYEISSKPLVLIQEGSIRIRPSPVRKYFPEDTHLYDYHCLLAVSHCATKKDTRK